MKHVTAVAEHIGLELDDGQISALARFEQWLADEAGVAGGIGPTEIQRLELRHIADSLLFLGCFPSHPVSVWDLGSGVGLPGIPLAIARPDVEFSLVDRSGRRVDLMRRAVRILELANCSVKQAQIEDLTESRDILVARASLPPGEMAGHVHRLVKPGGRAILAGSWVERPEQVGWETVEIPAEVLDQPVWLLMMHPA